MLRENRKKIPSFVDNDPNKSGKNTSNDGLTVIPLMLSFFLQNIETKQSAERHPAYVQFKFVWWLSQLRRASRLKWSSAINHLIRLNMVFQTYSTWLLKIWRLCGGTGLLSQGQTRELPWTDFAFFLLPFGFCVWGKLSKFVCACPESHLSPGWLQARIQRGPLSFSTPAPPFSAPTNDPKAVYVYLFWLPDSRKLD